MYIPILLMFFCIDSLTKEKINYSKTKHNQTQWHIVKFVKENTSNVIEMLNISLIK